MVGNNPASEVYVRNKRKACVEVGIRSFSHDLPTDTTEAALRSLVAILTSNAEVDGRLVLLPLPAHISQDNLVEAIDPSIDVDGFPPSIVGRLALRASPRRPCTPRGVIRPRVSTRI